jgi:hypothetical protein
MDGLEIPPLAPAEDLTFDFYFGGQGLQLATKFT